VTLIPLCVGWMNMDPCKAFNTERTDMVPIFF
jgi:hypothetical protein